jgi:hypothetical protein
MYLYSDSNQCLLRTPYDGITHLAIILCRLTLGLIETAAQYQRLVPVRQHRQRPYALQFVVCASDTGMMFV